jgi:transposase
MYNRFQKRNEGGKMSFKEYNQDQMELLPRSVHEYLEEGHLAKVIHQVVESLDIGCIEKRYSEQGCSAYNPRMLVKVFFYGYATGERSCRKLAYRLHSDLAYMYLAGHQEPDFRTLNRFRKDHRDLWPGLFAQIVRLCWEMGMIHVGTIALDGTKIKANASYRQTRTWEDLENEMEKILRETEKVDQQEDARYGKDVNPYETPEALHDTAELMRRLQQAQETLKSEGKKHINLTDEEAALMRHAGQIPVPSYNGQIAVEESHGVIVAARVSTNSTDQGSLSELVEQVEMHTGETPQKLLADSGFSSVDHLMYLDQKGIEGYIPDPMRESIRRGTKQHPEFHKSQFVYDAQKDSYQCPAGKELHYVKTDRYNGTRRYRTDHCPGCVHQPDCTKTTFRTLSRSAQEALLEKRNQRMESPAGKRLYQKRQGMVEPVFGHLKYNRKFRDFHLRGKVQVTGEFLLMCIGVNLQKVARYLRNTVPSPQNNLQPA